MIRLTFFSFFSLTLGQYDKRSYNNFSILTTFSRLTNARGNFVLVTPSLFGSLLHRRLRLPLQSEGNVAARLFNRIILRGRKANQISNSRVTLMTGSQHSILRFAPIRGTMKEATTTAGFYSPWVFNTIGTLTSYFSVEGARVSGATFASTLAFVPRNF